MINYNVIDLRSDTITKPNKEMLLAMFNAEVGDDFFGEDPTVKKLERFACNLFGKEAALYVASGTMANLCSVLAHCYERGQEVILGDQSHIHLLEQGNISQLGSIHFRTVHNFPDGSFCIDELKEKIRVSNDYLSSCMYPTTKLICLENTHNLCSGSVLSLNFLQKVKEVADEYNVKIHMDGARIFNAAVALKTQVNNIVKYVDSISVCLSKGLCCPMGSLVLGNHDFIKKVLKIRKAIGGSLRQSGYMAATGLYAIQHMVNRLEDDHYRATQIALAIYNSNSKLFKIDFNLIKTNIVYIQCDKIDTQEFIKRLMVVTVEEREKFGNETCIVKMLAFSSKKIRFITNATLDDDGMRLAILKIVYVIEIFEKKINSKLN